MTLPLHIAKKLLQLQQPAHTIAASSMQHTVVTKMLDDGILQKQQQGNTKAVLFIADAAKLAPYLSNHFRINNLAAYITALENNDGSRANNITASGNSKLTAVTTFKGFLVNSYSSIAATLNGQPFMVNPAPGSFTFVYDYENFIPDAAVTVVGIENPENFRCIEKQQHLFTYIQPLFVSRYPQSSHLVKWLQGITNPYLHFGDFDFSGINIYQSEYKKHLLHRASFFVPPNLQALLQQFGNKPLFNKQYNPQVQYSSEEENVQQVLDLILKNKKVLEQEIFITQR